MSFFFPSEDIKQTVNIFLFRQLMMSETLKFIFNYPLMQWPRGKKDEKREVQTFEYLGNEKSLLDEI